MWQGHHVMDADGHVMEPLWLWAEYIDPKFRDLRLRVARDAEDGDKLLINGVPSRLIRRLGGVAPEPEHEIPDWNHLPADGRFASYQASCTSASWKGPARLTWMNATGIDTTWLFPSLGLIWPREVDPTSPYALAHFDAYNRWITDMVSASPNRLIPVAQTGLGGDLPQRLERLADEGFRHIMLPTGITDALHGADEFFAAAQDLDLVVHLHKAAIPHVLPTPVPTGLRTHGAGEFFNHVNETLPGQTFLTALLDARIPDRYPRLRFAFHECNAGWVPAWADRAQESWETLRRNGAPDLPELPPLEYLTASDTLFFSIGLGEDPATMPPWLCRRLLLATDYPHPGTPTNPAEAWVPVLDRLSEDHARALLNGNAARLTTAAPNLDHFATAGDQ